MADSTWKILSISILGPLLGSVLGVAFPLRQSLLYPLLSFAGGTMLALSFLELIPQSLAICGTMPCTIGLLTGLLAMLALGEFFPEQQVDKMDVKYLKRASLLMTTALFLHNFPEGIALATGEVLPDNGLLIAMAIAIHDIPEGICTSAPYYYATGRRLKSFFLSASSAIPVLAGFFLGRIVFTGMNAFTMGMILGSTAGLMIYITCRELIPISQSGRHPLLSMVALLLGVALILFFEGIS